ncbi:SRPBCC family protein [Amycolatopsis panacis]|uniref:SRPBCC family protein n=1 Tax=Amycolatopsis panacis TaxID=2340917 RepID=A0A419HYE4_9PSEU|nr:SRPBCC family protein [Amycolatopsis panacis]RJQ82190.1 SRPBCC family protein [Amycolatopsis panacis]
MPEILLRHEFPVAAPPAAVAAHLSDPDNYVGLSPLVVAVRQMTHGPGPTRYVAVERFRFLGFLRYDNRIAVTLNVDGSEALHGRVVSPGGVRIDYRFALRPNDTGTDVTDTLHLHAPFGLLRFAATRAREVQLARGGILADRMANATP